MPVVKKTTYKTKKHKEIEAMLYGASVTEILFL
jgi:hypothetical protein